MHASCIFCVYVDQQDNSAPSVQSSAVDERMMRPGQWLRWSVLCVSSVLRHSWFGDRKDIRPGRNTIPLIPKGSVPEQVEDEDPRGEPSDPGSCGKLRLNGGSNSVSYVDQQCMFCIDFHVAAVIGSMKKIKSELKLYLQQNWTLE